MSDRRLGEVGPGKASKGTSCAEDRGGSSQVQGQDEPF